jgi:hypothetical protein
MGDEDFGKTNKTRLSLYFQMLLASPPMRARGFEVYQLEVEKEKRKGIDSPRDFRTLRIERPNLEFFEFIATK